MIKIAIVSLTAKPKREPTPQGYARSAQLWRVGSRRHTAFATVFTSDAELDRTFVVRDLESVLAHGSSAARVAANSRPLNTTGVSAASRAHCANEVS
jgi:hypothetical protein